MKHYKVTWEDGDEKCYESIIKADSEDEAEEIIIESENPQHIYEVTEIQRSKL